MTTCVRLLSFWVLVLWSGQPVMPPQVSSSDERVDRGATGTGFRLEVEVEHGNQVSRVAVYLRNDTNKAITFATGSAGGSGGLDDGFRGTKEPAKVGWIIGTGPSVVPLLRFNYGDHSYITIAPPVLSGPTKRSMRPETITIQPQSRRLYSNSVVPSLHIRGKFLSCHMELPDTPTNEHPRLEPATELIER